MTKVDMTKVEMVFITTISTFVMSSFVSSFYLTCISTGPNLILASFCTPNLFGVQNDI